MYMSLYDIVMYMIELYMFSFDAHIMHLYEIIDCLSNAQRSQSGHRICVPTFRHQLYQYLQILK